MEWRSRGAIWILQNFILVLICLVKFIMLLIYLVTVAKKMKTWFGWSLSCWGRNSHLLQFILSLTSPRSLYQMAISVRCHAVQDVITKSNEIGSTRSMGSSAEICRWTFTQIWLTFHTLNMNTLDVEEKHFIFITNLYHIKLYHNCGLSFWNVNS